MNGIDSDGRPVVHQRREARRPVPDGPLPQFLVIRLRQQIVWALTTEGYGAAQIAQILMIGERTVARYRASRSMRV